MTAVLQATDVLRKDRTMASLDDTTITYSNSSMDWKAKYMEVADMLAETRHERDDWKAKYMEVADMLAETRQELDDFQLSSKELEEELERELERTEKVKQDLRIKAARSEQDRDEWKSKFTALQTTYNTTTTSLQRELDTLRQDYQKIKVQLRDLEMGNDDLERNERAISSSLADIEGKYSRALEEKILLEHELLDKAHVEEEYQRLKDELRDANEEVNILKEQLAAASTPSNAMSSEQSASSSIFSSVAARSDDNLLSIPVPPDLQLSDFKLDLDTPVDDLPLVTPTRTTGSFITPISGKMSMQNGGFHHRGAWTTPPGAASSSLMRSSTVPGISTPSRLPPRTPARPAPSRAPSVAASANTAGGVPLTATKSRGVQMVSEMRARVKVLEQKIHTRVPRLRMGSNAKRPNANMMPPPPPPKPRRPSTASSSPAPSTSSRSTSHEERNMNLKSRRSVDAEADRRRAPVGDTSGWVLIMEDSPSPAKDREKEIRRISSPSAPSSFRAVGSHTNDSPSSVPRAPSALSQSSAQTGIRRPQSRLSVSTEGRSSVSTIATASTGSSIQTPTSRPATPTFLPVPSSGMYVGAGTALKLSTGPGSGAYSQLQLKRSSLGASTTRSPVVPSPPHVPHANITIRPPPRNTIPSALSQSRIGRPVGSGAASTRKSTGENAGFPEMSGRNGDKARLRSGSATALYGRNT